MKISSTFSILFTVIAVGVISLIPDMADAQCSMCRAVAESNQHTNDADAFTVGKGLNNAILYLMTMPYLLAVIFFYAFYRKQIGAWLGRTFSS